MVWCDNCLLLFPLRGGALAWAVFIALYNLAGSILLFKDGQYLFFNFPEWQIYGGIGMAVMSICIINVIAYSNSSYMWTRVCFFIWPIIIIVVAVRGGVMRESLEFFSPTRSFGQLTTNPITTVFQLSRQQGKIIWECNNGGQPWGQSVEAGYGSSTTSMPSGLCSAGFHSLYIAFVFSLALDFCFQVYA